MNFLQNADNACEVKAGDRQDALIGLLGDIRDEEIILGACDLRIGYMFYDTDENGYPVIFQDPEYADAAKQCLAWVAGPDFL